MKRKLGDGQTFLFSEHSGEYAINHKSQDLTKLLDQNKRLHAQAVRKLLNSPDYRYLKTTKRII